ncbi:MAG: radical SAM protein [Anaerolineaceae bacterium]
MNEFFLIPVSDQFLFYAPLYRYAQLLNGEAVEKIKALSVHKPDRIDREVFRIIPRLKKYRKEKIRKLNGPLTAPLFLGIIPTRGCNMRCWYCDFPAPKFSSPVMTLDIAQKSVDMYLSTLSAAGLSRGQIELFGGEPFYNNGIPEFVLSYSQKKSTNLGIDLQFKVTTNGLVDREKCEWIADVFDTVVLSLDGPAQFQNQNRPSVHGKDSFDDVYRSAKILSRGNVNLIIRSCITNSSVRQMPEFAQWFAREFILETICFEPLSVSETTQKHLLKPPDPVLFAQYYFQAQDVLNSSGIGLMTSGTDIDALQYSFCPVGKDAMIVTPDGKINACYLLEKDWEALDLNLTIGEIIQTPPFFLLNKKQLKMERSFNNLRYPICNDCFAKFHCAGGCHVHHLAIQQATMFDRLCVQTRLIILGKLLQRTNSLTLFHLWRDSISQDQKIPIDFHQPFNEYAI